MAVSLYTWLSTSSWLLYYYIDKWYALKNVHESQWPIYKIYKNSNYSHNFYSNIPCFSLDSWFIFINTKNTFLRIKIKNKASNFAFDGFLIYELVLCI